MCAMASQITSLTTVYSTVYSDADRRKHQSSASLAFVRGIHRGPMNSPHKWPVTQKMSPFDDVIMHRSTGHNRRSFRHNASYRCHKLPSSRVTVTIAPAVFVIAYSNIHRLMFLCCVHHATLNQVYIYLYNLCYFLLFYISPHLI